MNVENCIFNVNSSFRVHENIGYGIFVQGLNGVRNSKFVYY